MQKEIIHAYIDLLHQIILSGDSSDLPTLLARLYELKDGTDGLLPSFQKRGLELPAFWISYLRVVKFSLNYKLSYTKNYDFYMHLYDHLRSLPSRTADQDRMIREIGETLYRMDDLSGRMDRAVQALVEALRAGILESHNIITESRDRILASKVPQKAAYQLENPYHELAATTSEIIASFEHEHSLNRLSRLMAPEELLSAPAETVTLPPLREIDQNGETG